ncbi:hypothetical protein NP493_1286g00031 [Ridgeia piscesae]|uniref:Uncharacterized protein n=1 Tax=Ridgeia piscesae TaxID=27915 RepID=A0AAD9KAP0_RIDPI|nr:hypothetical protein NP493_1286g00031 [Ridgeia piscesae]
MRDKCKIIINEQLVAFIPKMLCCLAGHW